MPCREIEQLISCSARGASVRACPQQSSTSAPTTAITWRAQRKRRTKPSTPAPRGLDVGSASREVDADLPQPRRRGGVVGGRAGGLRFAVGEVLAGDALDLR